MKNGFPGWKPVDMSCLKNLMQIYKDSSLDIIQFIKLGRPIPAKSHAFHKEASECLSQFLDSMKVPKLISRKNKAIFSY